MSPRADAIAQVVLKRFNELSSKYKPTVRANGLHEWVALAGIVAEHDGQLTCLSLATGAKCLPASKIAAAGGVGLHDWHAEILAIRAFNRFLLDECRALVVSREDLPQGTSAEYVHRSGIERSDFVKNIDGDESVRHPFQVRDGVTLHMYCSEAPCGDASMELTMAAQDESTPWVDPRLDAGALPDGYLRGREGFSHLGIVRRKPGRADAPPTLSKSCSDKLALKQCTSLLSPMASLFIHPGGAYISSLIMPGSRLIPSACERAFSSNGRMSPVADHIWDGGYAFTPFSMDATTQEFAFSKSSVGQQTSNLAASNCGVAWSLGSSPEAIVGGVRQGKKGFDPRGASRTSRLEMHNAAWELSVFGIFGPQNKQLQQKTYHDVKKGSLLVARCDVKADVTAKALTGWVSNVDASGFDVW